MNSAWEHDTTCDAPCSVCRHPDWGCPYMYIACEIPRTRHLCPACDKKRSEQLVLAMLDEWYYARARAMYREFAAYIISPGIEQAHQWQLTRESVKRAGEARQKHLQKLKASK